MTQKITSIGDNAFYGCKNMTFLVVPESVTNASNLGANMLNGSSVNHIVFMGFNSIDQLKQRIISTNCFGRRSNCNIQLKSGDQIYMFDSSTQSIKVANSNDKSYGQKTLTSDQIAASTPGGIPAGKHSKCTVNKLYQYNPDLLRIFTSGHSGEPEHGVQVPVIIFFIDSKTSRASREFIDTILTAPNFSKLLADTSLTPNAIYMVLDRQVASDRTFFNKIAARNKLTSFPCVVFYYNGAVKAIKSFYNTI